MRQLRLAHTDRLGREDLEAIRRLLYDVFDDLAQSDYEHCLGGMHALVEEGGVLVAHACVVPRELRHDGRLLPTGYVEGVAVRAGHRRRGHGAAVMAALEDLIRRDYAIGALGATDEAVPFYLSRGWQRWSGTASVVTPAGLVRTPDDEGGIYLLAGRGPVPVSGDLACDWRDGDVW